MASIRKRVRKDGTIGWAVLWRDPKTMKQTSQTVETENLANTLKRLLDANDNDFNAVALILTHANKETPTVSEMLKYHLTQLTGVTEGTIRGYETIIEEHLKPFLGHHRVETITSEILVKWVKWMQERGKSPKTIANAHGLLSAAFQTGILATPPMRSDNPCKVIKLPKNDRSHQPSIYLTLKEYEWLEESAPEVYQTFLYFLVSTGTRFGEATALLPTDFDLEADTPIVRIEKAWKEGVNGVRYIGTPKSKRSFRIVSLPKLLVPRIEALFRNPDDLVFTNRAGGVIRSGSFHNFGWKPALEGARAKGLSKTPRPHDLRHTHASWLIGAGVNMFTVSRRLGHESIKTTLDLYGHLMLDGQAEASSAMDNIFS
ncbi:MAG: tyrosine-type recombinase/integrase [Microbacteriaceae bacterium]